MRLLIVYRDMKRVITVDQRSEIRDVARNVYGRELGDNQFKIEYFDKTFDSYVDLYDLSAIGDGVTLRLILSDNDSSEGSFTITNKVSDGEQSDLDINGSDCIGAMASGWQDNEDKINSDTLNVANASGASSFPDTPLKDFEPDDESISNSTLSISQASTDSKNFHDNYQSLPWPENGYHISLPKAIQEELKHYQEAKYIPPKLRKEIVNHMFCDLRKYTLYPTSQQYNDAAAALIEKYPWMQDRLRFNGYSRYGSWKKQLINKFREWRRDLKDPIVRSKKQKHGRHRQGKRKRDVDDAVVESSSARCSNPRISTCKNPDVYPSEDDRSIEEHQTVIKTEWKRRAPDKDMILDRMRRTFKTRRESIIKGTSTKSLLWTYPVLADAHWVLEEMKMICRNQSCHDDTYYVDLTSKILEKSWSSASSLTQPQKIPLGIKELMSSQKLDWMVYIPTMFNEKYDNFLIVDKEPKNVYPTILFNSVTENWTIHFDGEVVGGLLSFHHALACMIAIYWVFNVKFPTASSNTLNFVATFLAEIPDVKHTSAVCTKLNQILD